jgi:8-oxo-dGTP pyrophosphatase MutT (NUDIX family)
MQISSRAALWVAQLFNQAYPRSPDFLLGTIAKMNSPRWKPSVTVAAIIERGGRFLLVEEQTPEGLRLNNPAGHLDEGESPLQAAVRECLEETACVFTPQALLGVYQSRFQRPAREGHPGQLAEDVTYLRFAYSGTVGEPQPGRALDEPIVRTLWLTADEVRASAARHRSPLVLQCIEDHLAGRRERLDLVQVDPSVYRPG